MQKLSTFGLMRTKSLFFVLIVFFFFSCHVQKRHYRRGFYVSKFHTSSSSPVCEKNSPLDKTSSNKSHEAFSVKNQEETGFLALNTDKGFYENGTKTKKIVPEDTCGDRLLMKNGEELRVKIVEITDFYIEYKKCDNFHGPLFKTGKERVALVYYSNGTKEIVEPPVPEKPVFIQPNNKKHFPDETWIAIILPLTLPLIGVLVGLYFGRKAVRLIREQPDVYKGLNITRFMIIFDILTILLYAFIVFIVFVVTNPYVVIYSLLLAFLVYLLALIVSAIYYASRK